MEFTISKPMTSLCFASLAPMINYVTGKRVFLMSKNTLTEDFRRKTFSDSVINGKIKWWDLEFITKRLIARFRN